MLELSYRSWRLKPYAEDLDDDGAPFRWDPERRDLLRADLDAAFLHIYGLNRKEADRALESFPVVKKYDQRDFGEYRWLTCRQDTARVILDDSNTGPGSRSAQSGQLRQAARIVVALALPTSPQAGSGRGSSKSHLLWSAVALSLVSNALMVAGYQRCLPRVAGSHRPSGSRRSPETSVPRPVR